MKVEVRPGEYIMSTEMPKDSNHVASFPAAQGAVGKHRVLMYSVYQEYIEIDNRIIPKEVHVIYSIFIELHIYALLGLLLLSKPLFI